MHENEIAKIVLDICFDIHRKLGPGLLESVYEEVLCYELAQRGLSFSRQKPVPVYWKGVKMEIGFRTDVIVEDKVIVELKSVENMSPVFPKIVLTYLRMTGLKLALLLNFHNVLFKDGITRLVSGL
ncbi:MAG: GxxExxY protein [Chlorobi bacterium]|nr:GxxExxY protein [Chlorobiota bacterium]